MVHYIENVRLLWCKIIESEKAQRKTKVFESISNRFARMNRSHFRAQFVRVHGARCTVHSPRARAACYGTNWHSFSHTMQTSYLHPQFQFNICQCANTNCTFVALTWCTQPFVHKVFRWHYFLVAIFCSKRTEEVRINRHKSVIPNGTPTLRAGFKLRVKVKKMHTQNKGKQLSKKLMESRYEIS